MNLALENQKQLIDWITNVDLNTLISPIIGVVGVIIGILITEFFKRKEQKSLYSKTIYEKKLKIYERLFSKMNHASLLGHKILKESELPEEERYNLWAPLVIDLAEFTDKNKLYLNEEISIHCLMTVIGLDDAPGLPEGEQKDHINNFNTGIKEAGELIQEELGLTRLNKFFNKINKPKIQSSYIEIFDRLKKQYEKE